MSFILDLEQNLFLINKSYKILFSRILGKWNKNITHNMIINRSFYLNIRFLIKIIKDKSISKTFFNYEKASWAFIILKHKFEESLKSISMLVQVKFGVLNIENNIVLI